jgi:hypothetical protein
MPSNSSILILEAAPPGAEKPPTLPPAAKHAMAGDDEGNGIVRHGLAHATCDFRTGPDFFGQRAVGAGLAPADAPRGSVDAHKKFSLTGEVEFHAGEVSLLPREIAFHGSHRIEHGLWRRRWLGARGAAEQVAFGGGERFPRAIGIE